MKKIIAILIAFNIFTYPAIAAPKAALDDPSSRPARPADVWDITCNNFCISLNFEIGCSASSSTPILDVNSSYPIGDCLCGHIEAIIDSTSTPIPPVNP